MGNLRTILTPLGAQQMYKQGAAFRRRYLTLDATDFIQGMETEAIDNGQLDVYSQTDEWVVAGATAFMQGLYPPAAVTFSDTAGGQDLAHNYVGSKNATDYPMGGYQYPQVETLSYLDQRSIAYVSRPSSLKLPLIKLQNPRRCPLLPVRV